MKLAPRFVIAFGLLVTATTAGLGLSLREERRQSETARFREEVETACGRVEGEVHRQADADRKLLTSACDAGELVDRTLVALEAGELDGRRVSLAALVPGERQAFDLDELLLVTGRGDVLGADPRTLLGVTADTGNTQLAVHPDAFVGPPPGKGSIFADVPSLVVRCRKEEGGHAVGLLGARHLDPLLARIGRTMGLGVERGVDPSSTATLARAGCAVSDGHGGKFTVVVSKDTSKLHENLDAVDRTILIACALSVAFAMLLAVLLARGLSRPLAGLAGEARKVARGEAKPIDVRGTGEVAELGAAFNRMLDDLGSTRRRLAATTRVAAWREVARRVAHEVKNPLAPIRAAVETLRRLRARQDPAFDEYFDEATRTVLDEVQRISNIVTEFTRFARLPPPRPTEVDLVELGRSVITLHDAHAGDIELSLDTRGKPRLILADRDQIVQVVTNLVQNGIDALEGRGKGNVSVLVDFTDKDRATISVIDDGPGVSPEMAPRLFEPYATSKAKGTGLGLASAQRIAIEHGGELAYHRPPGGVGAEFRLVLSAEGPPPVSELTPISGPLS
ncbi:hypothetical protein BH09MYX1_BH09MYX1_67830 [soil metagenome]